MEAAVQNITLIAADDFSAKQYYACKVNSSGQAAVCGDGENAVGIMQDAPEAGYSGAVMCLGISFAKYGDTVAAGANLASDSAGRLVTSGGSDCVVGIALEAGAVNEIHPVLLVTRTATGTTGIANAYSQLCIPIKLANIAGSGNVVTGYVPGFAGTIDSLQFIATDPVTTPAKAVSLNAEIGGANVTGGVVALTSANLATLGDRVAGTAVTDANTFAADSAIDIEAASVTAFAEGEGVLIVTLKKAS